jgi:hypothetical protein
MGRVRLKQPGPLTACARGIDVSVDSIDTQIPSPQIKLRNPQKNPCIAFLLA